MHKKKLAPLVMSIMKDIVMAICVIYFCYQTWQKFHNTPKEWCGPNVECSKEQIEYERNNPMSPRLPNETDTAYTKRQMNEMLQWMTNKPTKGDMEKRILQLNRIGLSEKSY